MSISKTIKNDHRELQYYCYVKTSLYSSEMFYAHLNTTYFYQMVFKKEKRKTKVKETSPKPLIQETLWKKKIYDPHQYASE